MFVCVNPVLCVCVCRAVASLVSRSLSYVWQPTIGVDTVSQDFASASADLLWGSNPGTMLCGSNPALRLLIQALVSILSNGGCSMHGADGLRPVQGVLSPDHFYCYSPFPFLCGCVVR